MTRLIAALTVFTAALLLSVAVQAQSPKAMSATGTVSAVSPASLTVKGSGAGEEWTFVIDKNTSVTAKGATHKTLALTVENKKTTLPDFVKAGDPVTVSYHDMGGTKHAASIRVNSPSTPK
jgi:hypothetical protein